MIDENKYLQYGFPREAEIKGITIHETNNYKFTARELFNWLNTECKTSQGCSYIVDDTETIQVMPDDWAVYHTGKGIDYGTSYTLAIELVSNFSDEKFEQTKQRAIVLIKELMDKYELGIDQIYFHNDFNQRTYCPYRLLNEYGSARAFAIEELERS